MMKINLIKLSILFLLVGISSCSESNQPVEDINTTEPEEKEEGLPVFLIYGELAPDGYLDGEDPITEKYGFKLERIAGCEVSNSEIQRAHAQNKKSMELMHRTYGSGWQNKFEKMTGLKLSIPLDK